MNYSTAKTIIQTFRRERRITKKSKHMLETKKAAKREHFLVRFLTKTKLECLVTSILSEELVAREENLGREDHCTSEVLTAPAVRSVGSSKEKLLPRVESAAQMVLFEEAEEGPGSGQMTRAISVSPHEIEEHKHDLFYVYSDTDPEMKYKDKIDYSDPLLLRSKIPDRRSATAQIDVNVKTAQISIFDFREYENRILASAGKR
eukprot:TRINITY_DN5615_c0_g2_i15.p1 TRINITY_DN5615_c0_g2~~TRINITY_DN5615_c0_g2_i15.p1  ORF type:complete len:204 (-),score=55.70 TRINITY_DN5615_c0_g2_i15:297-908(-)